MTFSRTTGHAIHARQAPGPGAVTPEGPYETRHLAPGTGISNPEMLQFLDFIEQFEDETEAALGIRTGSREVRLLATLVRNHLNGKMTTSSSLAAASGLSYGTAIRAIADCRRRNLIVKRPRTATGKSFSLHPSPLLLDRWQEFARRTRSLLATNLTADKSAAAPHYFFGSSYNEASVLPLQPALDNKLPLSGDLRVLVHADPTFMAMHALKKHFQYIFGTGIQIRALSIDRLRQEILENGRLKASRYDIVACDLPWFGELALHGAVQPLDGLMKESGFDQSDFHPAAVMSTRYRGKQYGVPVQTTPELLVYRTDLFSEYGLPEPATPEAVLAAARKLHAPMSGRYGIAWNAARGTPLGHSFLMIMGSTFGQPIIDLPETPDGFDAGVTGGEHMRPMFLSDAARATAEYLMELLDYSPPPILSMSWYERAIAYASGVVPLAYCYTLLAPLFELDRSSPGYDNTGYLPHPVGASGRAVAPVGGYALAMPSNLSPERLAAAWAAVRTLTSPSAAKLYISHGSVVSPRYSVSGDRDVRAVSPIIPAVDAMARRGDLQYWPRPPVPEVSQIISIAGEELHDMLRRRKTVQEALETAQSRSDALMRAHGHY